MFWNLFSSDMVFAIQPLAFDRRNVVYAKRFGIETLLYIAKSPMCEVHEESRFVVYMSEIFLELSGEHSTYVMS